MKYIYILLLIQLIIGINSVNAAISWTEFQSLPKSAKTQYNNMTTKAIDVNIVTAKNGDKVLVAGNRGGQNDAWSNNVSNSPSFTSASNLLVSAANAHGAEDVYQTATSAGCNNGASIYLITTDPIVTTSRSNGGGGAPAPAPVITTNTTNSTGGSCSSYISSYTPNWSICEINGEWTNNKMLCKQNTISYTPISSSCGTTNIEKITTCIDSVCSTSTSSSCDSSSCPSSVVQPSPTSKNIEILLYYNSNNCYNIYANGTDTCNLNFSLFGIPAEGISGFEGLDSKNTNFEGGYLDQTTRTGNKGIGFDASSIISNNLSIPLNSIVPFNNTGILRLDLKGKNNYSTLSYPSINIAFKKPFTGDLNTSNDNGSTWNDLPEVGTNQEYKIIINNPGYLSGYSNGNLNISNSTFTANTVTGHQFENFSDINNNFNIDINTYLGFTARINAIDNILKNPIISSNNLEISYSLLGKAVKYYLTQNTNGGDTNEFTIGTDGENTTLGLKVVGIIQGDGKSEITGQEKNFSNLTKFDLKNNIRKNAYLLTKNMTNGQIVNGVKYIIGDYNISGNNLGFETIVIKDGNLIIDGNLNNEGNKLGVIILKDSYNVNSDYSNKGNVYIDNNVTYINSIIYADGGIISSKNGTIYSIDSINRTSDLQKQLIIKGNIFTKNTIGGAILKGGDYLLPGGKTTTSFDNAMIYDLNYLRRGNEGNDSTYSDYTIIEYNSQIQLDPPIGFSY